MERFNNSARSASTFSVRLFDNVEFDNKSVSVGSSGMDAAHTHTHTYDLWKLKSNKNAS